MSSTTMNTMRHWCFCSLAGCVALGSAAPRLLAVEPPGASASTPSPEAAATSTPASTSESQATIHAAELPTEEDPRVSAPLAVLRIPRESLASLLDVSIDRRTPVNDVILGTRVVGQARTQGTPTLLMQDDTRYAVFQVVFQGATTARTTGYNGPAIIYSRSTTRFRATKHLVLVAGKGFYSYPAKIQTNTQIVTEGIDSTRRGIIGRIVKRRAAQQVRASQDAASRIAKRNAERRIAAAFDEQMEKYVARLNQKIDESPFLVAFRGEAGDANFSCCSHRDYLLLALGKEHQRGATYQLPQLAAPPASMQIWVNKGLVGDKLADTLTNLNDTRTGMRELLVWASETFPTAVGAQTSAAIAAATSPQPPNFSYHSLDDWIVIQIGSPGK